MLTVTSPKDLSPWATLIAFRRSCETEQQHVGGYVIDDGMGGGEGEGGGRRVKTAHHSTHALPTAPAAQDAPPRSEWICESNPTSS